MSMHEFGSQTGIPRSSQKQTGKAKMESGISTDSQGPFPVWVFLSVWIPVWIPVCTSCKPGKSRLHLAQVRNGTRQYKRLLFKSHKLMQRLLCQTGWQNQMNSRQNLNSLCCKGEKKEKRECGCVSAVREVQTAKERKSSWKRF